MTSNVSYSRSRVGIKVRTQETHQCVPKQHLPPLREVFLVLICRNQFDLINSAWKNVTIAITANLT